MPDRISAPHKLADARASASARLRHGVDVSSARLDQLVELIGEHRRECVDVGHSEDRLVVARN